jgi:hypothetical protein
MSGLMLEPQEISSRNNDRYSTSCPPRGSLTPTDLPLMHGGKFCPKSRPHRARFVDGMSTRLSAETPDAGHCRDLRHNVLTQGSLLSRACASAAVPVNA